MLLSVWPYLASGEARLPGPGPSPHLYAFTIHRINALFFSEYLFNSFDPICLIRLQSVEKNVMSTFAEAPAGNAAKGAKIFKTKCVLFDKSRDDT